jgi:hypothetical protein
MTLRDLPDSVDAARRADHAAGLRDCDLAARWGVSRQAVRIWCERRGLTANPAPPAVRVSVDVHLDSAEMAAIVDRARAAGQRPAVYAASAIAAAVGRRDGAA